MDPPPPYYRQFLPPIENQPRNLNSIKIQRQLPRKQNWQTVCSLMKLQTILCFAIILMDIFIIGFHKALGITGGICQMYTGIWVGGLGLITASVGFRAFGPGSESDKCAEVAGMVMIILTILADGILIIFLGLCEYVIGELMKVISDHHFLWRAVMVCGSVSLVAASVHFTTSIACTAYICRNWIQRDQEPVTVLFVPKAGGANGNLGSVTSVEPSQILVPNGTQVVVLPGQMMPLGHVPNAVQ